MRLFELVPHLDLPGQRSLTVAPPIDVAVKQALSRLEQHPSSRWRVAIRDLNSGCPVRVEISLEELALLLERVDYSSGRLEDIEAMRFWDHLQASSEFLEALGYEWTNQFGFDCHESFTLAWFIPEGMVGYLAWLARFSRSTAWLPEEVRYFDPRGKVINLKCLLTLDLSRDINTAFVLWQGWRTVALLPSQSTPSLFQEPAAYHLKCSRVPPPREGARHEEIDTFTTRTFLLFLAGTSYEISSALGWAHHSEPRRRDCRCSHRRSHYSANH